MSRHSLVVLILAALVFTPTLASAQTDSRLTLDPWTQGTWGATNDHPIYQAQGSVKGTPDDAEVFWWDSIGRFRLDSHDPNALDIGYRWATMSFDTNSETIPDHLDEASAAVGFHFGDEWSLVAGAGYSGNNPFADTNGIFGIGHLAWTKALNDRDSLILSVDYNGNGSFLPDVPLPGVRFVHREDPFSFGVGFPTSFVSWKITPELHFDARYEVPYTADARLEYTFNEHFSVFGDAAQWFNGFFIDEASKEQRLYYQMSRAELGVRYRTTIWGNYLDVALVGGYAFDQHFSTGFDVRELDNLATLSDEPYIGIEVVGRF